MLDFWIALASADCNLTTQYQSDKQKIKVNDPDQDKGNICATHRKSAFTAECLTRNNEQ